MREGPEGILFREEQRFGREWVWLIVLTGVVPLVVIFGLGLWQQLVWKISFGNQPMSDRGLVVLFVVALGIVGGVAWMIGAARLETEVRPGGVFLRYRPLHHLTLPARRIVSAEVRRYSPIAEFGGWGIRYGFSAGWAWNVSGDLGVQLVLDNGRKVLVGSHRPAELKDAIDRMSR